MSLRIPFVFFIVLSSSLFRLHSYSSLVSPRRLRQGDGEIIGPVHGFGGGGLVAIQMEMGFFPESVRAGR